MVGAAPSRSAAVAWSGDPSPHRAGLLAAAEAAAACGRDHVRSAILFASGTHSKLTSQVALGAAEHLHDATVIVVGSAGVITPDGEQEGATAVTALTLAAPMHVVLAGHDDREEVLGRTLGEPFGTGPRRPMLLFAESRVFAPKVVEVFQAFADPQIVVGGGVARDGRVSLVAPGKEVANGVALAARIDGGVRLAVGMSQGLERLTDFMRVDELRDGLITRLDGRRPLAVLAECADRRTDRPRVLALLVPAEHELPERDGAAGAPLPLVRAVGGIQPAVGAIFLSDEVRVGDRVAFAVLDADTARAHFESTVRDLVRSTAGGVPLAALYVECTSRGSRLHGRPGVGARILRAHLPGVPFAGMHSSFELGPFVDHTRIQTFSGAVGILYAPS